MWVLVALQHLDSGYSLFWTTIVILYLSSSKGTSLARGFVCKLDYSSTLTESSAVCQSMMNQQAMKDGWESHRKILQYLAVVAAEQVPFALLEQLTINDSSDLDESIPVAELCCQC